MHRPWIVHIVVISACLWAPAAAAAQVADAQALQKEVDQLKAELETLRQQYQMRLSALEARLATLGAATPAGVPQQPALPPTPDVAAASAKVFNPDMSVIGNFVGVAGENALSDQPSLSLTEVEAAFQAVVDPYARADFFLSASPEGLEVEEGYITFTSLPAGVLLKAGKMRAQFGKVNTMHTHILPWADRPLVSQNLFGGEEGLTDAGISVSEADSERLHVPRRDRRGVSRRLRGLPERSAARS